MPPSVLSFLVAAAAMPMTGKQPPGLIFLGFIVATLSAYAAQELARQAFVGDTLRGRWLWTAGFALASGMWSGHFIGMLGFRDPNTISYDINAMFEALAIALMSCVAALFIVASRVSKLVRWLLGSAVAGSGLFAMHYVGMSGLQTSATLQYDRALVALSAVAGVGLTTLAFWCAMYPARTQRRVRFLGAPLMGAAVAGLHYTGMTGVTLTPSLGLINSSRLVITPGLLALIVGASTLSTFALAALALAIERRAHEQVAVVLSEITDAFYAVDRDWRVTYLNPQALKYFSEGRERVLYRKLWDVIPQPMTAALYPRVHQAVVEQSTQRVELTYQDRWYETDVYPSQQGVSMYLRDITDRKAAEHALRQAAAERDLARNRFLQIAAHELRNPMAGVKSLLSLMQWLSEEGKPMPNVLHAAELMEREIDRMSNLLNEIIEAFQADEGVLDLEFKPIDLAAIVRMNLEPYRNQVGQHQLTVDLPPEGQAPVHGDPDRLGEVVRCLLANAVKYSLRCGEIHVRLVTEGNQAVLSVCDDGIGIPVDELDRVFDGFFRGSNLKDRDPGGLGLGLFITRQIVRRHGGEIHVQSSNHMGATFTVSLPLHRPS